MKSSTKKIWLGSIPECFGYGLMVVGNSRDEALKQLRKAYYDMRRSYNPVNPLTFVGALEYFGGGIREIEIGKVYYEGFNE